MTERETDAGDARLRRWAVGWVVAFFMVDSLLRAGYFYYGARANGLRPPLLDPLLSEITGSVASLVGFFSVVLPVARRFPLRTGSWVRSLPAYGAGFLAYSVSKTLLMWGQRSTLWPVVGLGSYDYGTWGFRFAMEAANDVFSFAFMVAAIHLFEAYQARRDREVREARLETRLHEARLEALQGQLQPHFLFNTLNTISSVMYADPNHADQLMSRLSDLLRSSLVAPDRPEVTVEEELELLARYVDLMKARFGDRLSVGVRLDPAARGAAVPVFLLQPLVENAIQHGVAARSGPGRVDVDIAALDGELVVQVRDDGPGPADLDDGRGSPGREGVGLRNTRARLALLYGSRASLELGRRPEGGAVVEARFPARIFDAGVEAHA